MIWKLSISTPILLKPKTKIRKWFKKINCFKLPWLSLKSDDIVHNITLKYVNTCEVFLSIKILWESQRGFVIIYQVERLGEKFLRIKMQPHQKRLCFTTISYWLFLTNQRFCKHARKSFKGTVLRDFTSLFFCSKDDQMVSRTFSFSRRYSCSCGQRLH